MSVPEEEEQVQTAAVVVIVLIAAVLVARKFVRKGRGREGCGCDACSLNEQCGTDGGKPDSCKEE